MSPPAAEIVVINIEMFLFVSKRVLKTLVLHAESARIPKWNDVKGITQQSTSSVLFFLFCNGFIVVLKLWSELLKHRIRKWWGQILRSWALIGLFVRVDVGHNQPRLRTSPFLHPYIFHIDTSRQCILLCMKPSLILVKHSRLITNTLCRKW